MCLTPSADADGGRGLLLVGALASCWGVSERTGPGKTVWAEVDLTTGTGTPAGHAR